MRIANIDGRAYLVRGTSAIDIAESSAGEFSPDPQQLFARWNEVVVWAESVGRDTWSTARNFRPSDLDNPVGVPRQIFAIGLNYAEHAAEANLELPAQPVVFTKFASSLTGADVEVPLHGNSVDWEAELVAVIGDGGRDIAAASAWDHVAGFSVGQDLSDRTIQWWAPPAQFSLGKSLARFAPIGPWVVSLDELRANADPADLEIGCTLTDVDGTTRVLQNSRTKHMIFSIPTLIEKLSASVELLPGDIIFTGTPAGVGMGMTPPVYLAPGQVLTTTIEGIGSITQRFLEGN